MSRFDRPLGVWELKPRHWYYDTPAGARLTLAATGITLLLAAAIIRAVAS